MTPTTEETAAATKPRASKKAPARKTAAKETAAPKARAPKAPKPAKAPRVFKKDRIVEMLRRPAGATIKELCEAFGIQAHSARGMISTTGKRLGTKATRDEKGAYHLPPAEG